MLTRILVAAIFVPILFVFFFFLPPVAMALLFAFISSMAAWEFLKAAGGGKLTGAMKAVSVLSSACIPLGVWMGHGGVTIGVCAYMVAFVSFGCAVYGYGREEAPVGFHQVTVALFAGVAVPAGHSALVALKCMEQGKYLVLLAVVITFLSDTGAYFVGMFLGKHRGILPVSPKKSAEGFVGGFVSGALFALLYGLILQAAAGLSVNYLHLALIGLVGSVCTALGDLAFSLVKRECGVKDYGKLLPGHGGMMDRFDSMVFSAPVVLFLVTLLPVF